MSPSRALVTRRSRFNPRSADGPRETCPKLFTTILGNMMRDFSERLRRANDEVRALEQ
jgi:hypothetical protein